jgi:hypothetical protein
MDITNDPSHGVDSEKLAESLIASRDPRILYVISNRKINSSVKSPWQWRAYNRSNPHDHHVHVSVVSDRSLYDDTRPWSLPGFGTPIKDQPAAQRYRGITATVFSGGVDSEKSAYDGKSIGNTVLGVALPYRFKAARPLVRVIKGGKFVDCKIVDVGPWNINDPYWIKNTRPQAESGTDMSGRKTNLAGIDLTPAAASAIGLQGKGKVDWEFVGAGTGSKETGTGAGVGGVLVGAGTAVTGAVTHPHLWPWFLAAGAIIATCGLLYWWYVKRIKAKTELEVKI